MSQAEDQQIENEITQEAIAETIALVPYGGTDHRFLLGLFKHFEKWGSLSAKQKSILHRIRNRWRLK